MSSTLTISTTSKHRLTSAVCYCKQHDRQRASPFSQKSFVSQNIFGSPNILGVLGAYFTRPSLPRRSTALRQQFAIANSTTDSGLLLFPKNLLFHKIFSGALIYLVSSVRISHAQVYPKKELLFDKSSFFYPSQKAWYVITACRVWNWR